MAFLTFFLKNAENRRIVKVINEHFIQFIYIYIYMIYEYKFTTENKNELKKDTYHIKTLEVPGTKLKTIKFNCISFITKTFH